MAIAQLDNYITSSKSRVKANKDIPQGEFDPLAAKALARLSETGSKAMKADLNGVTVELVTNSAHQASFWADNWKEAERSSAPHARIYSAVGVPDTEPSAYYCPPLRTALFLNTEYYGQCKSWALGMAAAVLEERFSTLSIHGATAEYKGRGVVIIAPTGTGKTTQSFKIFMHPEGKICGDDWAYISFPDPIPASPSTPLIAKQPEKALYMRSETQKQQGWLRGVFDRSRNENVTMRKEDCDFPLGAEMCSATQRRCVFNEGCSWCYYAFANSRVLVRREEILGPSKVVDEIPVNLVVLLRRDGKSPAEVRVGADEAILILKSGEYMVLPGAGPKEAWGSTSHEPWYNPYLLELDNDRQERYFRAMFENWKVPCMILNTGVESVEESHQRVLAALEDATPRT